MLDSITRLREVGRLVAYSARRAGRDMQTHDGESRRFNRAWRGAMHVALRVIVQQIHEVRADCDHEWDDEQVHHETESTFSGAIIERWHGGFRTCRLCGLRKRVNEPCDCDLRRADPPCRCKEDCRC